MDKVLARRELIEQPNNHDQHPAVVVDLTLDGDKFLVPCSPDLGRAATLNRSSYISTS